MLILAHRNSRSSCRLRGSCGERDLFNIVFGVQNKIIGTPTLLHRVGVLRRVYR